MNSGVLIQWERGNADPKAPGSFRETKGVTLAEQRASAYTRQTADGVGVSWMMVHTAPGTHHVLFRFPRRSWGVEELRSWGWSRRVSLRLLFGGFPAWPTCPGLPWKSRTL